MKFEWDEEKSEANYKKHGVRFEEDHSDGEDRFIRVGSSGKLNVLLVIFCERDKNITRIISARKATAKEKKIYEEGI